MEPEDLEDFYTFVIWKKINSRKLLKEGYLKGLSEEQLRYKAYKC